MQQVYNTFHSTLQTGPTNIKTSPVCLNYGTPRQYLDVKLKVSIMIIYLSKQAPCTKAPDLMDIWVIISAMFHFQTGSSGNNR